MTRNLKALGLALVAIFALSAMAASTASAQLGKITTTTATPIGHDTGTPGVVNSFHAFAKGIHCATATYGLHKAATTPHQNVVSGGTEVTVTPTYGGCTDNEGRPATVIMTGCDYRLSDATTTGGVAGTYGVSADLICPEGVAGVHIEVFNLAHEQRLCLWTITPQAGHTGLHLTNSGTHTVLQGMISLTHVIRSGICTLDGQGTTGAGLLLQDITVTNTNISD